MGRRRVVQATVAGLVAGSLVACASNGAAIRPIDHTGCYQFERTQIVKDMGLPWGFELFDELLTEWTNIPDGRVARTRISATEVRDHPFRFWRELEGDTVEVGHPGGGGFALTLAPEGYDLAGVARPVGDVVRPGEDFGPREAQPVIARRVVCAAPS